MYQRKMIINNLSKLFWRMMREFCRQQKKDRKLTDVMIHVKNSDEQDNDPYLKDVFQNQILLDPR